MSSKNIVIFASGSGSSAENIILSFKKTPAINVAKLYCNKPDAFVLQRIKKYNVESLLFNSIELNNNTVLENLTKASPDLIVLAGFLQKIPEKIINAFKNKIINIHPSLLPKYKGLNTHLRAIKNKDKFSGASVHKVTQKLDSGKIILQKKIKILKKDTVKSLEKKVLKIEHEIYPKAIVKFITNL